MFPIAISLILAFAIISGTQPVNSESCNAQNCALPSCRCPSTNPPAGLELNQIPQFVFFTFDDAVQVTNYHYYAEIFYNRTNPDGCPVGSTYFLSHDYTDYSKVHDLYVNNQEIALHSITHAEETYWQHISYDNLTLEFKDEIKLVSHFAKIPEDAFHGMRLPYLQLSGDDSYRMAKDIGLRYDCSWPTQRFMEPGLWPYTLDFPSTQDCPIGVCPKANVSGLWVVPMIDWKDTKNVLCSMVDGCANTPTTDDEILKWYISNFNRSYLGNKAPFGFYLHASWFIADPTHLTAYIEFVDYLQKLPDVYIVGVNQALDWMENPLPIGSKDWPACRKVQNLGCTPRQCELRKGSELRYMTHCADSCPSVYPWLGNPLGQ